jgi:hypothetical protein
MIIARTIVVPALTVAALFGAWSCDSGTEAILAALGEGCVLNSDCSDGLVCAFQVCHQPCVTNKDCPRDEQGIHRSCIAEKPVRVCQLPENTACVRNSDCSAGLVCALDDRCRNACEVDRDCVSGQVCIAASCVDPEQLGPGGVLPVSGAGAEGKPCSWNSDCGGTADPVSLVCRAGICSIACFGDDRDCGRFERCTTHGTTAAGACQLIGPPGTFVCSPKEGEPDREIACACLGGTMGTQVCEPDGSGYGPCLMGGNPCGAP